MIPRCKPATRCSFRSRHTTELPKSAKHAPVVNPTYPAPPTTQIFAIALPYSQSRLCELAGDLIGYPMRHRDAVVLSAVLGIDLKHVCQVHAGQRRFVRRNVLMVVDGYDRLSEWSAEYPRVFDPGAIEA